MSRIWPTLLAGLVPLACWSGAWAVVQAEAQAVPEPDARVRGLVTALSREPEVLIVGNSQAQHGVDGEQLGRALRAPTLNLGMAGATTALSWALLRHGVFGAGHHPSVIVIPMAMGHLVDTTPPFGVWQQRLAALAGVDDPVLEQKVYDRRWPALERSVDAARALRDRAVSAWTRLPARAWGLDVASVDAAADAVLGGAGGVQMAALRPALTAYLLRPEQDDDLDLDATLLPDIFSLAAAHDARVVLVTVPQRTASLRSSPALARRIGAWARERGGALLHLEDAPIPAAGWLDDGHLNEEGRAAFTRALGAALLKMNAVHGPLRPPPLPPPAPQVVREGPPAPVVLGIEPTADPCVVRLRTDVDLALTDDALRPLGFASPLRVPGVAPDPSRRPPRGCVGMARVEAGGVRVSLPDAAVDPASLRLRWEEPADAPDAWWVPGGGALQLTWALEASGEAVARVAIVAPSGRPGLAVGGVDVPLVATGNVWVGVAPAGASLDLRVVAPDGPAFLASVVLEDQGDATWLVGGPSFRPDRVLATQVTRALNSPRRPGQAIAEAITAPDALRFLVDAADAQVGDEAVGAAFGGPYASCSPFVVREASGAPRHDLSLRQAGEVELTSAAPTGAGPWTLALGARRRCRLLQWIQPGETLRLEAEGAAALHAAGDRLTVSARSFPPGLPVGVRVWQGWELRASTSIVADAEARSVEVALAPSAPVMVELEAPSGAWVLASEPVIEAVAAREVLARASPAVGEHIAEAERAWPIDGAAPDGLVVTPPDASVERTGEVVVVRAPAEPPLTVCWPDAPAGAGRAGARLTTDPPVPASLFVRWLDARGAALPAASSDSASVAPGRGPAEVRLRLAPPAGAVTQRLCLRRGHQEGVLQVLDWVVEAP